MPTPKKEKPRRLSKYDRIIAVFPKVTSLSTWVDMYVVIECGGDEKDLFIDKIESNLLPEQTKKELVEIKTKQKKLIDLAKALIVQRENLFYKAKGR